MPPKRSAKVKAKASETINRKALAKQVSEPNDPPELSSPKSSRKKTSLHRKDKSKAVIVDKRKRMKEIGNGEKDEDDMEEVQEIEKEIHAAVEEEESKGESTTPLRDRDPNCTKEILTGTYLLRAANSSELSRRLKHTWTVLQHIPNHHHQADVPLEALRLVCVELLNEKIMEHGETSVRSLAACCVVELLRIYAPDMPFKSNEELYDAFQLILEQLRCLAIEGNEVVMTKTHSFSILESLASVKSCLLLIGMEYTPEEDDNVAMVQLFETFFNTICKDHSVQIEQLMLSVMVSCIEESDTIEQPLLDVILSPLVYSKSQIDAIERGPYHMAQELIRRTSDHLQSHLSRFFNTILVDAASSMLKTSELKEHVYTLIYEVHKINPSLLLYVLPNICMQLQVDEVATRSEAIALMGRLFSSTHADYGHDYMKNFRDFLGRFRDVSKEIRLQMVQVCAIIWQQKPELAPAIEKEFVQRLNDPEWEVRRAVVNEVCDLAANNLDAVSEDCLKQVGERMKDKKVVLRKETMTGLSQVYAAHISVYWDKCDIESADVSVAHLIPHVNSKKLGWIPDFVLKCFAYPQQELKLRVFQLLDDILLPKSFNESCRAKGFLYLYHSLDKVSKEALRRIVNERNKCQMIVTSFLRIKQSVRGQQSKNAESAIEKAKESLQNGLTPLFHETDNVSKVLITLVKWKDQSVFKQLELLCNHSTPQPEVRNARDRLIKSVGSKTALGLFLKNLCRQLNQLTFSPQTIATYLAFLDQNNGLPHRENRSMIEILVMISKVNPELLTPFIREEFEMILVEKETTDDESLDRDQKVVVGLLNVLANYSVYWRRNTEDENATNKLPTPTGPLKRFLFDCCTEGGTTDDGTIARYAAIIIANFFAESKEVGSLMTKLCSKKLLSTPQSSDVMAVLHSLNVLVKKCPQYLIRCDSVWQVIMENFILQESSSALPLTAKGKKGKGGALGVSKLADIRCLAIKFATNLLLHCFNDNDITDKSLKFVKLLFEILRSDGRQWATSGALPAKYRSAASCALIKLARHRTIEATLSVPEWHLLGFVMQDSSEDVRAAFVKKLTNNLMIKTVPHPHKYLSYLALAATESSSGLKKTVRGLLGLVVERMRKIFEASSNCEPTNEKQENQENQENLNALMVPEYALPYVVHLIAHHPDLPAHSVYKSNSIIQDPEWSEQVAYISFFLDGFVTMQGTAGDNVAFLLQILTKMSSCHDASSPNNKGIYPLIECAVSLLKRRIKNQSNLKAFPGKIFLPKQLYAPGRAEKDNSVLESSDDEGNVKRKGPRISTSLSPIKVLETHKTMMDLGSPLSSKKRRASPTVGRRKSLKSKNESTPGSVTKLTPTPPRRQSLLRQARIQTKIFVDHSSESEDDLDDYVPTASVASRAKRESNGVVRRVSSDRTSVVPKSNESDEGDGLKDKEKEEEEMTSFRSRRRKS